MINPNVVEGQIAGGTVQGIGGALLEDMAYDEDGNPLATTFVDYLLPTSTEVPDIEYGHLETPGPMPGGYKGVGEGGAIGAPPAVVNGQRRTGAARRHPHTPAADTGPHRRGDRAPAPRPERDRRLLAAPVNEAAVRRCSCPEPSEAELVALGIGHAAPAETLELVGLAGSIHRPPSSSTCIVAPSRSSTTMSKCARFLPDFAFGDLLEDQHQAFGSRSVPSTGRRAA